MIATLHGASDFVTASADHQDAVFRLVQYSTKLLAQLHYRGTARRRELAAISSSIDSSRALTRTFGVLYALQTFLSAVRGGGSAMRLTLTQDLALLLYHPLETWYWVLHVSGSPKAARQRMLSRLVSALALAWAMCAGASAITQARQSAEGAGSPGGSSTRSELRRHLTKLLLDALLALHWMVDGPGFALREWQVGLMGTVSAYLGLRAAYHAHERAASRGLAILGSPLPQLDD